MRKTLNQPDLLINTPEETLLTHLTFLISSLQLSRSLATYGMRSISLWSQRGFCARLALSACSVGDVWTQLIPQPMKNIMAIQLKRAHYFCYVCLACPDDACSDGWIQVYWKFWQWDRGRRIALAVDNSAIR